MQSLQPLQFGKEGDTATQNLVIVSQVCSNKIDILVRFKLSQMKNDDLPLPVLHRLNEAGLAMY